MPLTPTGRRAIRRAPKDPVRVAVGSQNAQSDRHISKIGQIRSSHLGYDCYVTGSINSVGRIRIIQRGGRLPPHLTPDARLILPTEMWWPQRDHRSAHALVDAVIGFDLGTLRSFKAQWPEHEFGFEQFLELAERHKAAAHTEARSSEPQMPSRTDGEQVHVDGGKALPRQMAMFPGQVVGIEPHGRIDADTPDGGAYSIRTAIARFDDGLSAFRIDIVGHLGAERTLCSRAYVDLIDGRFEIVRHYPGRLRALGLPAALIYEVLGVRSPRRALRRELTEQSPRVKDSHVRATHMRRMQTLFLDGPGATPAPIEPKVLPDPVPVVGNSRFEQELLIREDDPAEFPSAPGQGA